jgi:pyrroline-5-carboxylate reductase
MGSARSLMLVGGGKMGEALLGGLLGRGWAPADQIVVIEPVEARRKELAGRYQGISLHSRVPEISAGGTAVPDGAVLAVKPADAEAACRALAPLALPRVLSIAAGVTTSSMEAWLAGPTAVIRAMPNTPALVGAGAAAVAGGSSAGQEDLEWARGILEAVGTVVTVSEAALDAVTGLSGSGPAYVFLVAEALIDAGVLVGLTRPVATQLAIQTLLGSARMMAETGEEPSALRAQVTSPGGTTAAGLRALESAGVRAAILEAVAAATERSRQLGAG